MNELIKLAVVREWAHADAIEHAEVVGHSGRWTVHFQSKDQTRTLATKANDVRYFGTFESAIKVLHELGLPLDFLRVNAARWNARDETYAYARRRPDRSAAMQVKEVDARYVAFLRESLLDARHDTRPLLSDSEMNQQMDAVIADHLVRLDAALVKSKA